MNIMMRSLQAFLLVALILAGLAGCSKNVSVTSAGKSIQDLEVGEKLIITPEDLQGPIIEAINSAEKNIKLANFHLSNRDVVVALKNASHRGVKIEIILDNGTLSKSTTAQKIVQDLKSNGVEVKSSSTFFSITHQKSFVIDGKTAFVSSINLVTTTAKTRDFGLFTKEESVVTEMMSVFDTDWENADTNSGITPALTSNRLLWSPINSLDKLKELILSSKKELKIMVENLGNQDMLEAFIEKAKQGVHVQVLTPGCVIGDALRNRGYIKTLTDNGVESKVSSANSDAEHPYVHAKMILVDGETFYIGSENFTNNSLLRARELGIITNEKTKAEVISKTFDHDWSVAQAPEEVTKEMCDKASSE